MKSKRTPITIITKRTHFYWSPAIDFSVRGEIGATECSFSHTRRRCGGRGASSGVVAQRTELLSLLLRGVRIRPRRARDASSAAQISFRPSSSASLDAIPFLSRSPSRLVIGFCYCFHSRLSLQSQTESRTREKKRQNAMDCRCGRLRVRFHMR